MHINAGTAKKNADSLIAFIVARRPSTGPVGTGGGVGGDTSAVVRGGWAVVHTVWLGSCWERVIVVVSPQLTWTPRVWHVVERTHARPVLRSAALAEAAWRRRRKVAVRVWRLISHGS